MLFDWDDANIFHLARHDITPSEAEQVLWNDPVDVGISQVDRESRLHQVGVTNAGRMLTILSVERGVLIRVITGWIPTKTDRATYLANRKTQLWRPN
jgi:uncharacterized DUF497 family protein